MLVLGALRGGYISDDDDCKPHRNLHREYPSVMSWWIPPREPKHDLSPQHHTGSQPTPPYERAVPHDPAGPAPLAPLPSPPPPPPPDLQQPPPPFLPQPSPPPQPPPQPRDPVLIDELGRKLGRLDLLAEEEGATPYEHVALEDMEYDDVDDAYYYPCPCGDRFVLTAAEYAAGRRIAPCPSCSLVIRVD